MYTTFGAQTLEHVRAQNGPGAKFLQAYKDKYGTDAVSTYVVTGIQALQVILKAIESSDGSRKGVRDAVFDGAGTTVPAATAILGKDVSLDPKTGDITVHDVRSSRSRTTRTASSRSGP
jgi:branched-chain amino acid transport system substrate-binding protein